MTPSRTPHVRFAHLPEILVPGRRLGRHIVHDEQSHDHPAEIAAKIVSVEHKAVGLPLDQADVGSCTAEATTAAGNSQPNLKPNEKSRTQKDAYALYGYETKLEGQPWPPNDPGGSGLEVCKAAKQLEWITSYTHAFGIEHALLALVKRPVITGVSWYDSFDTPDENGLIAIKKGASIRGGHEIVADQIIAEHELVGFWQSWGDEYGVPADGAPAGRFYMSYATWEELLAEQGDVTVPIFA